MASTFIENFSFLHPYWLLSIPIIMLIGYLLIRYIIKHQLTQEHIIYQHTSISLLTNTTEAFYRKSNTPIILFIFGLILSCIALARPQIHGELIPQKPIGHEVVLLIDISQSMSIRDYRFNGKNISRFDVLKSLVSKFISDRPNDHFSIIVFSSKAATLIPMTHDIELVKIMLDRLTLGLLGEDTSIGDALALSIKQIKNKVKNKPLVIIFSDGDNTSGSINPSEALALAKTLNFKIYTIAITSKKISSSSISEVDFKKIATSSGGKYYHAKNSFTLQTIIADINNIEKTITPKSTQRKIIEWFYIPLILSLLLIAISQLIVSRR